MIRNTVVDMLEIRTKKYPDNNAYYYKNNNKWINKTWSEYYNQVSFLARSLIKYGFESGDKICLLGGNKPQWIIGAMATQMANGTIAGIYNSCSAEEVSYIVNHAQAKFLIIENYEKYKKQVKPEIKNMNSLIKIILMEKDNITNYEDKELLFFEDIISEGSTEPNAKLTKRRNKITEDSIGVLIYTSGTTGPPKAVMLSHKSVAWTVDTAVKLLNVSKNDHLLSYLPLAHIAEQMFSLYCPLASGAAIYFAESMEKMPENLKEVQPTVFFGVPRVYEKIYSKLIDKLKEAPALKAKILSFAQNTAKEVWKVKNSSDTLSFALMAKYLIANKLVFEKLKPLIGFGNLRVAVTGAAPISKEILEFFQSIDLPIYEVYGQSEDCGPTSFNVPGATKLGTVGKPFPGVDVKIATDGEILVKGPNVFDGYYKDQEATQECIADNWLYTGDIGQFDNDGYLKITDRKKDLIITAGGKNISPQNIETMLKQIDLVSQAVVIGDKRKYLSALITLDDDKKQKLSEKNNFIKTIQSDINTINQKLASVEQIKKFEILPNDLSIENGELTPTMKVKRKVVNQKYAQQIESMY